MKKLFLRILLGIGIGLLLFFGLFVYPYFANILMPWQKAEAIATTLIWGGLAELPESAQIESVTTHGSMITREFRVRFSAPHKEIQEWIKNSTRLKDKTPEIDQNNILLYEIYPGEEKAIGGSIDRLLNSDCCYRYVLELK